MSLENSMQEAPQTPLAVEHARVYQAMLAARSVLINGLKNYNAQVQNEAAPTDKLWILHPAIVNAKNILEFVIDDD